ncbi:CRISPR type AFERR-associated protein Csf2 [Pseudomonas aeruginosa]|nr:type IV CRISPR-associated protein Csf2 [Pseudomonas aeruginosa]CRN66744.1 CRISPR type AFERR-associated protein Csf2 [Pseudomonas aeruginosa]
MQIEILIRNITPIFSAAPGSNYVSLEGTINPPLGSSRFPLTRARTMSVVADTGDGVAKAVSLPIVPGNTMRNLLRRTMLKEVIEPALCEKAAQLSIGAYATAYAGNSSGNPDGMPSSFDEIVTMRSHPFLGLFGGGPRMLQGRLMVDSLYPIHQFSERIIGTDYINDSIKGSITEIVWTRRNDPVLQLGGANDVAVIDGGTQAANDWITSLLASNKEKKGKAGKQTEDSAESADSNGRGLKAFNAHEVVIGGVKWLWRINVDRPSGAQVGLILLAINKLANQRIAGGHAKDYGRFAIEGVFLDGTPVWSPAGISAKDTEHYFDAIAEALDSMTGAEFEQFAASAKEA